MPLHKKKGNDRANSRHFLKDVGRVVRLGRGQPTTTEQDGFRAVV
jgi:hypothetical protein